jgi:hypothetical protein
MRFGFCSFILLTVALALSGAPALAQDLEGTVQVDQTAGTATYTVQLNGPPRGSGFYFFTGYNITSINFTPGSILYFGIPVDFSGTEASWLANSYSGGLLIPNFPGTAVDPTGTGKTTGPAGKMNSRSSGLGLDLGVGFTNTNIDIVPGFSYDGLDRLYRWNSPVVPELNGSAVTVATTNQITAVDPVNGIVDITFASDIRATPPVETFTVTGTYNANLPGVVVGQDVDFTGGFAVTSLDFAPGAVSFAGTPVDFDGTEASFLANSYTGDYQIPSLPGFPVEATGTANTTGGAGNMNSTSEGFGLALGPGFSSTNLDLVPGESYTYKEYIPSWNSPVVPELNGAKVHVTGTNDIVGIDPINGIVDVSGSGSVFAIAEVVPTLSMWGLAVLLTGLLGFAILALIRRRQAASV